MNHEHPLIAALRTAGPATQRIAESLLSPYYDHTITEAARLADALIEDQTGHTALQDRWIAEDRGNSVAARAAARERTQIRTQIAMRIDRFDREMRDAICRALAAGDGAALADELVERSTIVTDAAIADANRDARVTAVAS